MREVDDPEDPVDERDADGGDRDDRTRDETVREELQEHRSDDLRLGQRRASAKRGASRAAAVPRPRARATIASARSRPTAGASMKPCPLKPAATQSPSRPHFAEDRLVVGRDVVDALDEEWERDELERGSSSRSHARTCAASARARRPGSPAARRSLASTRPSASCFAAKWRSGETTSGSSSRSRIGSLRKRYRGSRSIGSSTPRGARSGLGRARGDDDVFGGELVPSARRAPSPPRAFGQPDDVRPDRLGAAAPRAPRGPPAAGRSSRPRQHEAPAGEDGVEAGHEPRRLVRRRRSARGRRARSAARRSLASCASASGRVGEEQVAARPEARARRAFPGARAPRGRRRATRGRAGS